MKKLTKVLCLLAAVTLLWSVALTVQAARESEPNDTSNKANKIAVGEKVTGRVLSYRDYDYFSFEITKSGYFYLEFNVKKDDEWQVRDGWRVYVENQNVITYSEDVKESGTTYEMPFSPGVYCVAITAGGSRIPTVDYCFTVHEVEDETWEQELNNTRESATPIPKDTKKINAITEWWDGTDYFSFEIPERSMVEINFAYDRNLTKDQINQGMDLWIYKSDEENERYKFENVQQDKTFQIALPAGKYYIEAKRSLGYGTIPGSKYSVSYKAKPTEVYAECDRGGEKFATNKEGLMFYKNYDNGNVYCYDEDGAPVFNQFACDGTYTYFFQADRTAMRSRLTYHPDGVHVIYFDEDGHEVFSDFANVKKTVSGEDVDDYCFFNVYGYLYVDVLTWDKEGKKLLYANPYGVLECNGWFQFSKYVVWADGTTCEGIAGGYGFGQRSGYLMRNMQYTDWNGAPVYLQGNGVATWDF